MNEELKKELGLFKERKKTRVHSSYANVGRKRKFGNGTTVSTGVRLPMSALVMIKKEFGSLQNFFDDCLKRIGVLTLKEEKRKSRSLVKTENEDFLC